MILGKLNSMPSTLSWLDFSNADRRKVMEVLALFRLQDTRDELGLASIRDTFADLFFPGTSTLQTRARYFLFVPWLYLNYIEAKQVPSNLVSERLRQYEVWIINALQRHNETDGVIGQRSGQNLQRFPSSIYWNGLRQWGLLRYPGSMDQYHRWLNTFYQRRYALKEAERSPEHVEVIHNWEPNLPPMPPDFWETISFQLTYSEASYLRERLLLACRHSALAFLVENARSVSSTDFLWNHPQRAEFPPDLDRWCEHAQNFSECLHGASLLYNYLLAGLRQKEDWEEMYAESLENWQSRLTDRLAALMAWDRADFWRTVKTGMHFIHPATERFLNTWLDGVLRNGQVINPIKAPSLHRLIEDREAQLKHSRSRFINPRHREQWSGAAGVGQLDYRWRIAQRLVNDILEGLQRRNGNDAQH